MSLCDFCGVEFFSKGVTALGMGTFCGHACKVKQIHQNAGLFEELRYYRCGNCQTVMTTPFKEESGRAYWCRCWTRMVYQFSVPVDTDERRALAKRGTVYNPHAKEPEPLTLCVRCGDVKAGLRMRPDGLVCLQCYHAEAAPEPLRTPEEIAEHKRERTAFLLDQDDRLEAAYRQKETTK